MNLLALFRQPTTDAETLREENGRLRAAYAAKCAELITEREHTATWREAHMDCAKQLKAARERNAELLRDLLVLQRRLEPFIRRRERDGRGRYIKTEVL